MLRARVGPRPIAMVGYDEEQQILEITFRDGRVYHYLEVPPERALSLMRAESKGRFLNSDMRAGVRLPGGRPTLGMKPTAGPAHALSQRPNHSSRISSRCSRCAGLPLRVSRGTRRGTG